MGRVTLFLPELFWIRLVCPYTSWTTWDAHPLITRRLELALALLDCQWTDSAFLVLSHMDRIANWSVRSYYTVIQVGGIYFRVALDTASADLWLVSSACVTDSCKRVPPYPLSYNSSTFVSFNNNATYFKAHYADNTCMCSSFHFFVVEFNSYYSCIRIWRWRDCPYC